MALSSSVKPIKLIQITDTHLYGRSTGTLLKMNTEDSLRLVVDMVVENEGDDIDLIIATGDIAQDASVEAYHKFLKMIEPLNAPCRWIPGNHDLLSVMEDVAAGGSLGEKEVRLGNWQLVMLNTSVIGQVHGRLEDSELSFLKDALGKAEADDGISHSLVCLHHNPVQGNAGWMKDIGLHNESDFFDIVSGSDTLRGVVYGHVHQELDGMHKGVRCICTPSTCIQFKPEVTNFALDAINPGYRRFQLSENGDLETEVFRVSGSTLEADFNSPGY